MKYLKYRQSFLNEKFESQFLTKTTGWLSKMKLNSKPFIDDLKKICEDNSIPLSTITDNFFDVNILANKALKMRAPEDSINYIWAIKFWFSATDGYKRVFLESLTSLLLIISFETLCYKSQFSVAKYFSFIDLKKKCPT